MSYRKGLVFYQKTLAGTIKEHDDGYSFTYDEKYLASAQKPISLTLPLQEEPYESKQLFSFFDGLIPEGWLLELAEQNWKLNPRDRMGLLLSCCNETIGAVSVRGVEDE